VCRCRRRHGGNTHAIRFVETVNDEATYARFESQQIIVPVFRDQQMRSRQFACPQKSTSWVGLNQRKSDEAAPTIKNAVSDRLFSAAICCSNSSGNHAFRKTTAAGLPAKVRLANASTTVNRRRLKARFEIIDVHTKFGARVVTTVARF